jgi:hypothetical protein
VPTTVLQPASAANSSQCPDKPLRSCAPRGEKDKPAPATRSVTTRETRTSPAEQWDMTRAATCTPIPAMSLPRISTSPVWRPARRCNPVRMPAAESASAQRSHARRLMSALGHFRPMQRALRCPVIPRKRTLAPLAFMSTRLDRSSEMVAERCAIFHWRPHGKRKPPTIDVSEHDGSG